MPGKADFKYVLVQDEDEIVIQAGCVDSDKSAKAGSSAPVNPASNQEVPLQGMRRIIIALSVLIVAIAVIYCRHAL